MIEDTGSGVLVEITAEQETESFHTDPHTHLVNKATAALEAYSGLSPNNAPVHLLADLQLHTPDLHLDALLPDDDYYVLASQALPDSEPLASRTILLHGWIQGADAKRYGSPPFHTVPPAALSQMTLLLTTLTP